MRLVGLSGVALSAMTMSADAQALERWQPADCASFEAGSLEAALLDCDTEQVPSPGKRAASSSSEGASATASVGLDALDEGLAPELPVSAEGPAPIQFSSQDW